MAEILESGQPGRLLGRDNGAGQTRNKSLGKRLEKESQSILGQGPIEVERLASRGSGIGRCRVRRARWMQAEVIWPGCSTRVLPRQMPWPFGI